MIFFRKKILLKKKIQSLGDEIIKELENSSSEIDSLSNEFIKEVSNAKKPRKLNIPKI